MGSSSSSLGRLSASWPNATVTVRSSPSAAASNLGQRGRAVTLNVYLAPNDEFTAVMLEIPVPAGMLLPSIDSVRTPTRFVLCVPPRLLTLGRR